MTRRFPGPWIAEIPGGYKVVDATGQSLAYVYRRETKAQADIAKVLTMDEARRMSANIATDTAGTQGKLIFVDVSRDESHHDHSPRCKARLSPRG